VWLARSRASVWRRIEFLGNSLAIYREIGDRHGEASALWNTALGFDELGRRVEATGLGDAALQIFERIQDPAAGQVRDQLAQWRVHSAP